MWSTIFSMIKSDDDGDNVCVCMCCRVYTSDAADEEESVGVCVRGCVSK